MQHHSDFPYHGSNNPIIFLLLTTMKHTQKLLLLFTFVILATSALLMPRTASAQNKSPFKVWVDCVGSSPNNPSFFFSFTNDTNLFINEIRLTFTSDSIGWVGGAGVNNSWGDGNVIDSIGELDFNPGGGIGLINRDSALFYFLLGGLGSDTNNSPFPLNYYGKPITITWQAVGSGHVVLSGTIPIYPSYIQSVCTLDTVTGTASVPSCDPIFNFTVFNRNTANFSGYPIDQILFTVPSEEGTVRPSEVSAPPGWSVDYVTAHSAHFSGFGIPSGNNLSGFRIGLSTELPASNFSFFWTAYNGGALIDYDTVFNVSASPNPCSANSNPDTVFMSRYQDCTFNFTLEIVHGGSGNSTPSPITEYTFKLTKPAAWESLTLPQPTVPGTWQYNIVDSQTVQVYLQPKYRNDTADALLAGATYSMKVSITGDSTHKVPIAWSDSSYSLAISSGVDTVICKGGLIDTTWPVPNAFPIPGTCTYKLVVLNQHTSPTSSLDAIALSIPGSEGTFLSGHSSNKWDSSVQTSSMAFTNLTAPTNNLQTGSTDTITFVVQPKTNNAQMDLTVFTYDATSSPTNPLSANSITVPGCTPPVVADSVHHTMSSPITCSDTLKVINRRPDGVTLDSISVQTFGGWSIATDTPPNFLWTSTLSLNNTKVMYKTSSPIPTGTPQTFILSYTAPAGTPSPFGVDVITYPSSGSPDKDSTSITCTANLGVSVISNIIPMSVSIVPNPMQNEADITLTTGTSDRVNMTLLDVLGRSEKTVADGMLNAGDHSYSLDVSTLPNGTYYLRIQSASQTLTKKLVVEH